MKRKIKLGEFYILTTAIGTFVAQWKGVFNTKAFGDIPPHIIFSFEEI